MIRWLWIDLITFGEMKVVTNGFFTCFFRFFPSNQAHKWTNEQAEMEKWEEEKERIVWVALVYLALVIGHNYDDSISTISECFFFLVSSKKWEKMRCSSFSVGHLFCQFWNMTKNKNFTFDLNNGQWGILHTENDHRFLTLDC